MHSQLSRDRLPSLKDNININEIEQLNIYFNSCKDNEVIKVSLVIDGYNLNDNLILQGYLVKVSANLMMINDTATTTTADKITTTIRHINDAEYQVYDNNLDTLMNIRLQEIEVMLLIMIRMMMMMMYDDDDSNNDGDDDDDDDDDV